MKIAGHKGTLDWEYINKASKALEKTEAVVERIKIRQSKK